MSISISGIKIPKLELSRTEDGLAKVEGSYELISNSGTTLAKQSFGGYNGIVVTPSPATTKLFHDIFASIKSDINAILGLE